MRQAAATATLAPSAETADESALVALVGRIRVGDADALGALYDLTLGRVYGLALRILRQPQDAEEVASDVYLQVWDRAVSYCPARGAVMAWLLTITWSRAVDRQRRLRRQSLEQPLHPDGQPDAYTDDESSSAEALFAQLDNVQALRRAFVELTQAQRTVLELSYRDELSYAEVAQQTGLPLGTVKSHARRGLAALRDALQAGGHAP
ncbi:MAG: sigma-70 family RNA polymerase sigma factor [Arenimonas sp.]|nr:sigma-70 family RNA polymerase sigma factor [Arenimonas sp.]MBP6626788.1 sigma-70 family RNA polymerase sigma factor [Arenimonas sp.]